MERLPGIDASFLYTETPTVHMHTIKVAVLEPSPGYSYTLERVKADLGERLHLLPPFRRRLVKVPLGLHHPVWIEDPAFDLDQHVFGVQVPPPGGGREMDAVVSRIASQPLARHRPLWELWVLHGLAGGRVAAVGKIHHAVADGVAVAALLANVMAEGGDALAPPLLPSAWAPEPVPSPWRLVRDALRERTTQTRRLPHLVRTTAHNLLAVARRRRGPALSPPLPVRDVPATTLNGALSARRWFASTALPLADVRAVKAAAGVTMNDVLLAVVAGALRAYLLARGGLPARSLVAEVPVATDRPGAPRRLTGNRLSNLFTSLCTDVADPVERLRRIHAVTEAAKEIHQTLGPEMFQNWTEYAPPAVFAWWMRLYSRLRLADRLRPPINVIVSSVPGPRQPLGWPGGRLEAIYSVGPLVDGVALNITGWSYVDRLCLGMLGCPDRIPDPDEIVAGLQAALAELVALSVRRDDGSGVAMNE